MHGGDQNHHRGCDHQRRRNSAQRQSSFFVRLGKRVSQRCSERASENIRGPEEPRVRDFSEVVKKSDKSDQSGKHQGSPFETKACVIGREIAQSGTERIGNEDREPVEEFIRPRRNVLDRDTAGREAPNRQDREDRAQKHHGRLDVSQASGAIEVIRGRCADRGCRDDYSPISGRMITPRPKLRGECDGKEGKKNGAAYGVAEIQRHRQSVSAGLSYSGSEDLDDPEGEGDGRNFAQ